MRSLLASLPLIAVVGCVARPPAPGPAPVAQAGHPASALAYDPPATVALPDGVLARGPREGGAFVGFDQGIINYTYVRTVDRQYTYDGDNDFDRRAVTARVGVSYR